jgi:DNA-binding GntR family transcriptional regulator
MDDKAMQQIKRVDRKSFEPSYTQLVNIIQEQIANGELRAGDRLPSESQLCKYHKVSPMTVRRAINILVEQGYVIAEQGRGTFIKPIQVWEAVFRLDELQHMLEDPQNSEVKILELRLVPADDRTSTKMGIAPGKPVLYIRRLIYSHGKPLLYHREFLIYDPLRPIVESEMEVTSLKGLFKGEKNSALKRGTLTIEATVLTPEESQILKLAKPNAAFRLEHIFYDFDDKPVSWGWFICPGDYLRFTATVGVPDKENGHQ